MLPFLSEENYEMHMEYLRTLRLKYSIYKDDSTSTKNRNKNDILRQNIKNIRNDKSASLLLEITLHDVFFNSFSDGRLFSSDFLVRSFGSEAGFLNQVFQRCMDLESGFLCVFTTEGGIHFGSSRESSLFLKYGIPNIAIDLCEHAYFLDYGFDRERYLRSAISYLDASKLG